MHCDIIFAAGLVNERYTEADPPLFVLTAPDHKQAGTPFPIKDFS